MVDKGDLSTFFRSAIKAILRAPYALLVPLSVREYIWGYRHPQTWNGWKVSPLSPLYLIERARSTHRIRELLRNRSAYKDVVVFPPSVLWDVPLFQRPQQMAMAFAQLGYLVIYWEDVSVAQPKYQIRQVSEGVYAIRMPPQSLDVIPMPLTIAYTYNYNWVRRLHDPVVVYEFIDHLDIFSNFPRAALEFNHAQLLARARIVVGTGDDLVATIRPTRSDAILVPNGVDYDHFAGGENRLSIPGDVQAIVDEGKPIIGYYGALAEWFDYDLIHTLARAMPDCNFVLIGPAYDGSLASTSLSELPNVRLLGKRDYHALPEYLHAFSVATIPFKLSDAIQAVSPIKLFEYMAGGKPIVTSDMTECRKYPEVLIATSPQEWISKLREAIALSQDEDYAARVRVQAQTNTWLARAQTIIHALAQASEQNSA